MIKPDRALLFASLVVLVSVVLLCFCTTLAGGDVTETGNARISGRVVDTLGFGVKAVYVQLFPAFHDPVREAAPSDSLVTITDESGNFIFHAPTEGVYTVEAFCPATGNRAIISGINAVGHDTVFLPSATIQRPGAIKTLLSSQFATGYVYLPGTTRFGHVVGNIAIIDSVPAGYFSTLWYVDPADTARNHIVNTTNFTVTAVSTAFITDNRAWGFSKRLSINTTLSGAAISGNVCSFPVLVRLSAGNFDFSQAKSRGEDVRFVKEDGSSLPFEIDRWDPVTELAEVWVRADTIYGNDSTHYFIMLWGDSSSTGSSNSCAVFDTTNGFAGVWHLGQPEGTIIPDATANGNAGTATATTTVAGAVGTAQLFDGISSMIRTSGPAEDNLNFPEDSMFSVSAWVRTNVLDSAFHGIVYKSNLQYGLQIRPQNSLEFVTLIDKSRWEMSRSPLSDESWHLLAGVRSGSKQYLYVDGVCADSSIAVLSTNLARAYDQLLEIGHCPDGGNDPDRFFNGIIDEVRVSNTAYSVDWIKLCFMNQKEQDALVKW